MNEYKTNNRMRIMEYLLVNENKTVSVKDIDNHLKEENCPVNLTTIYRYLDKLEKDGHVIKYTSEKGDKTTYQFVNPGHRCDEHLHLKCIECGNITHLDCHFMDEISSHIQVEHGFTIQCKNSVIYGVCQDCMRKKHK